MFPLNQLKLNGETPVGVYVKLELPQFACPSIPSLRQGFKTKPTVLTKIGHLACTCSQVKSLLNTASLLTAGGISCLAAPLFRIHFVPDSKCN